MGEGVVGRVELVSGSQLTVLTEAHSDVAETDLEAVIRVYAVLRVQVVYDIPEHREEVIYL